MAKQGRGHRTEWRKRIGRMVCVRCGTVQLRNDVTARIMAKPCADDLYDHKDHE